MDIGLQSTNSANPTANLNYQDTWHAAVGAIYRLSDQWRLSTGLAYDSSAVSDDDRTVMLPMGEAWWIGRGASWQMNERVHFNAGYEFLWSGNMSVDQDADASLRGRVAGEFAKARFSFFTMNLTWKFQAGTMQMNPG